MGLAAKKVGFEHDSAQALIRSLGCNIDVSSLDSSNDAANDASALRYGQAGNQDDEREFNPSLG